MSFVRPTAAAIKTPAGLLDILVGLYERMDKPSGGNLTQFITAVVKAKGGALSSRNVNTTAPLAGGGSLASDLTLSLNIDGSLQVSGGALGVGGRVANQIQYGAASGGGLAQSANLTYVSGAVTIASSDSNNFALNFTQPGTIQQINKTGASLFVGTSSADLLGLYTNNVTRLTISSAGAVTVVGLGTGLVKATAGVLGLGSAGTDYEVPLTFSTGLTRTVNTITANLSTGISGGQSVIGGTGLAENLTLRSTTSGTKGAIQVGNAGSIGTLDENTGKQSWGNGGVMDAFAHFVLSNDTTPTTIAGWDGRHAMFGASGSTGAGIGFSHTSGTGGNLLFISPGLTWETASIYAQQLKVFTGGSNTLAVTVDGIQNVTIAGGLTVNHTSFKFTESAGPTLLTVGAIPDSNPDSTVLLRPSGAATVVGVATHTLQTAPNVSAEIVCYVEIPAASITAFRGADGWLEPSNTTAVTATHVEFPAGFAPVRGQISVNLIANTITAGTVGVTISQNGTVTGLGGITYNSGSATGITNSATFALASAATDGFGVVIAPSIIAAASGPLILAIRFRAAAVTF